MNRAPLAALLLALLIAPASFLALPSRAHAIPVTEVGPNLVENTITAVKQTLSTALDVTNTAANVARQIKAYVLDPLAFVMSGNLLKTITSSMLGFVGGQNSSGRPLYISNLRNYLQNVGDVEAYSFLNQFQSQSNSPFAAAITSSLRANYLQSTSAAGFFAANQSTLGNYSSNPNGFVSGNWGLGGWAAWMGLTTAPQNDPYTDYFIAQNQLYNQVGTAQSTKLAQANWGQGFLASCGSTGAVASSTTGAAGNDTWDTSGGSPAASSFSTIPQPGDPCTRPDGSEGQIQTPGSIIHDYLSRALNALGIDQFIPAISDASAQLGGIMGNLGTVFSTINYASSLFSSAAGGFSGFSGVGTSYSSPFSQYLASPGYMGLTTSAIATAAQNVPGADVTTRAGQYGAAWTTIGNAADAAAASLTALANSCPSQSSAALSALSSEVQPVESQAAAARTVVANANALSAKVAAEGSASNPQYAADYAALTTAPPSTTDVVSAQSEAASTGLAGATSPGALTVGGGSTLDRLVIIKENADATANNTLLCPPPPPPAASTTPASGGGGSDGGGGGG